MYSLDWGNGLCGGQSMAALLIQPQWEGSGTNEQTPWVKPSGRDWCTWGSAVGAPGASVGSQSCGIKMISVEGDSELHHVEMKGDWKRLRVRVWLIEEHCAHLLAITMHCMLGGLRRKILPGAWFHLILPFFVSAGLGNAEGSRHSKYLPLLLS